jgi:hypothetical protein
MDPDDLDFGPMTQGEAPARPAACKGLAIVLADRSQDR